MFEFAFKIAAEEHNLLISYNARRLIALHKFPGFAQLALSRS